MITVIPRKIMATSVNGVQVADDGSITLPVDNAPTTNSTNLVTSGGVKTELDALSARIGNAENPAQVWTDVSFTIPTSSWSLSNNKYTTVVQSSSILATSGVFVNYDSLDNAAAPITAEESTGQVTFTTDTIPTGTITGTFRIVDSVNGIVPVARGGTGTNNLADALTALGAVAKSGDTMTGRLTVQMDDAAVLLKKAGSTDEFTAAFRQQYNGSANRTLIQQRVDGSAGSEGYYLPAPDAHDAFTGYVILTNKNPVTIAQGGTGATTAAAARTQLGVVAKAGDTMTGNLTISNNNLTITRTTTPTEDSPARISFSITDSVKNNTYSDAHISVYGDHGTTTYGTNMVLQSGGNVFIGGGESPTALYKAVATVPDTDPVQYSSTSERLYLCADNAIFFDSNANTITNRVGMLLDTAGALAPTVADVSTNNKGSLGTSSYWWGSGYITRLTTGNNLTIQTSDSYKYININDANGNRQGAWCFNGSGRKGYLLVECTDTTYHENFVFPPPDTGRTANKDWNILTDKNPVTIAQGGTGATTANTARYNLNVAAAYTIGISAYDSTHSAITAGHYVYVRKHNTLSEGLYVASAAITKNAALSTSNLTAVSDGGLNHLFDRINTATSQATISYGKNSAVKYFKRGNIVQVHVSIAASDVTVTSTWGTSATLATLPAGYRPTQAIGMRGVMDAHSDEGAYIYINTNGTVVIKTRYYTFDATNDCIQAWFVYATAY